MCDLPRKRGANGTNRNFMRSEDGGTFQVFNKNKVQSLGRPTIRYQSNDQRSEGISSQLDYGEPRQNDTRWYVPNLSESARGAFCIERILWRKMMKLEGWSDISYSAAGHTMRIRKEGTACASSKEIVYKLFRKSFGGHYRPGVRGVSLWTPRIHVVWPDGGACHSWGLRAVGTIL